MVGLKKRPLRGVLVGNIIRIVTSKVLPYVMRLHTDKDDHIAHIAVYIWMG